MAESRFGKLGLPQVAQVGYVVRDLEASMKLYDPLFGPFRTMDGSVKDATYRGRLADCKLELAFGWSGDVEIELIQWVAGDCPHREFIEKGREGMHHLRFPVPVLEPSVAAAEALGYRSIWDKRFSPDMAVAYLERPGDTVLLELFERQGG